MKNLTKEEIQELVSKLGLDDSAQDTLINAEGGFVRAVIDRTLRDALHKDAHLRTNAVIDTILKLKIKPHEKVRCLVSGAYKSSTITKEKRNSAIDKIIDEQIAIGVEAKETLRSISLITGLQQKLANKAHGAWVKLKKETEPKRAPLKSLDPIKVDTTDDLTIDDNWTTCKIEIEHGTQKDQLVTLMILLSDSESSQRVLLNQKTSEQANSIQGKLKAEGFKQTNRRTMREWVYITFERQM